MINDAIISPKDARQIAEILGRRANEIAMYSGENRDKFPGSVDLALDREIKRLRRLEDLLKGEPETEDEDE